MTDRQKEVGFAVLLIAILVGLLLGGLLLLRLTGREARWRGWSSRASPTSSILLLQRRPLL
jgi:hypothetical protein